MISFAFYSVCVGVSITVLWGLWRLTGLRTKISFVLNRFVLLSIPVISLLIGLIPFIEHDREDGIIPEVFFGDRSEVLVRDVTATAEQGHFNVISSGSFVELIDILVGIYYVGLAVAVFLFVRAVIGVVRMIVSSDSPERV